MIGLSWLLSYLWYISPRFQPPHQLFFFFYFFLSFFSKKQATKSLTSFPCPLQVRWRSPPLCTSLLYAHTALPLSLFLTTVQITFPHSFTTTRTHSLSNTQNVKQKLKKKKNRAKWKSSRKQSCVTSSPLLRVDHHFRDEADDGRGRLIGIHLCEQVTDVVCCAALLSGHKAKEPVKKKNY